MEQKRITENPTIADQVLLTFTTPDSNGCLQNPYKLETVNIYFIERNFVDKKTSSLEVDKPENLKELEDAKQIACNDPSDANLDYLAMVEKKVELAEKDVVYYNAALLIEKIGESLYPAYLSTDATNCRLSFDEDEDGNPITGTLKYIWNPSGVREGDYLITYSYQLTPAGTMFYSNYFFFLGGSTLITTSIPTHFTKEGKYETLQERYLPEMFKMNLCANDLSPDVLSELNNAVAKGFTFVEDFANQTIDLMDANATNETFLNLLASGYGVRLKSTDPTLWRRQIKQAVPLYKKKGTLKGLIEAFSQSGIRLVKFTKLWQVISPFTNQELFNVTEDDQVSFELSKEVVGTVDNVNFEIYYRPAGDSTEEWQKLSPTSSYVTFTTGSANISWIGNILPSGAITLQIGDSIRVIYTIAAVTDQSKEDYIRNLQLSDQRDERDQDYPLKNWNVRVIEEDDSEFDTIINEKHPYHDYLIFGKVRTEFPYSENIYNMEEYNACVVGSTYVITENGIKQIKDLNDDKLILTEYGIKNFEGLKNQGKKPILEIKTKLGRSIKTTFKHRLKTFNTNGKLQWKYASELRENDYILGKKGNSGLIPLNHGTNSDVWYLAGYAYGDGSMYENQVSWLIPEDEPDTESLIKNTLNKYNARFNVFNILKEKHQLSVKCKCNKNLHLIKTSRLQLPLLGKILPEYEIRGKWKSNLPKSIWASGEKQIGAFLRGLFDSDGSVQKGRPLLTTKWQTLAREVQSLLLSLGIISSVTSFYVTWKNEKREYFRVRILGYESIKIFMEKINFNNVDKKYALKNNYFSTNVEGEKSTIMCSDRTIIPYADNLIKSIFPSRKRKSFVKQKNRDKKEKRLLTLITRLKQGYQTTLPDNVVGDILKIAENHGVKNESFEFLKDYIEQGWFFDRVKEIKYGCEEEVFDPLNVKDTGSYVSEGLISHNSKRDSLEPCDIDKDFMDPCSKGLSSKYNIDLEIENLSDNRIFEAIDVLTEYMPFHAVLHSMNLWGSHQDFVATPAERITALVRVTGEEITIADPPQTIFYRKMDASHRDNWKRETLASMEEVYSENTTATLYNNRVVLFSPNVSLEDAGITNLSLAKFEVYDGSNIGEYDLSNISKNTATAAGVTESPLDQSQFIFRISNLILNKSSGVTIAQEYNYKLSEKNIVYLIRGVQIGWTVVINSISYNIIGITTDNKLELDGGPAASATSVEYEIFNGAESFYSSKKGIYEKEGYGVVEFPDTIEYAGGSATNIEDIGKLIAIGDYFLTSSGEYKISNITDTHQFQIENYTSGATGSGSGSIYRRVIDNSVGFFNYEGINLISNDADLESTLGIIPDEEGSTDNDLFKENFLVLISGYTPPSNNPEATGAYYSISSITGSDLVLNGPMYDLGTDGVSASFKVYKFTKTPNVTFPEIRDTIPVYDWDGIQIGEELVAYTPGHTFDFIDRRGNEVIDNTQEVITPFMMSMNPVEKMLNAEKRDNIKDSITQQEQIGFVIEKRK